MYQISGWIEKDGQRGILLAYAKSDASADLIAKLFEAGGYRDVKVASPEAGDA